MKGVNGILKRKNVSSGQACIDDTSMIVILCQGMSREESELTQ